jgi:hypothetical protein
LPEFRTRFHYTALNRSVELGRVGFLYAEVSGWTPGTRYKTSFYSMLGGVGQTMSGEGFRPFSVNFRRAAQRRKECSPPRKPWVNGATREGAPKGRKNPSIPEIFFIHGNSVLLQKRHEFILKRPRLVMLPLMGYVVSNGGGSRLADGKRTVAGLPCKKMVFGPTPVYPFRRIRFYETGDFGDGKVGGHTNQKMDVIASSIHA